MIATEDQARASFQQWFTHHYLGTMNHDQVRSVAESMTTLFMELTGQRPIPNYSDRRQHELRHLPVTAYLMDVVRDECNRMAGVIKEALADDDYRAAADAKASLDNLERLLDRLVVAEITSGLVSFDAPGFVKFMLDFADNCTTESGWQEHVIEHATEIVAHFDRGIHGWASAAAIQEGGQPEDHM